MSKDILKVSEREYTKNEIDSCRQFYQIIVSGHDKCGGTGLSYENGNVCDCTCEMSYKYVVDLLYARIPRRYWYVERKLASAFLESKDMASFSELCSIMRSTKTFMCGTLQGLSGESGTGKTILTAIMARCAVIGGHKVVYITADDFLKFARSESEHDHRITLDRLNDAEYVFLDDFDLAFEISDSHRTSWAILKMQEFTGKLYDEGKALIFATKGYESNPVLYQKAEKVYTLSPVHTKIVVVQKDPTDKYFVEEARERWQLIQNRKTTV